MISFTVAIFITELVLEAPSDQANAKLAILSASISSGASLSQLVGTGVVAGIGFTVAIFITELALVAQRNLLLLNDLLFTTNAEHRSLVPNYTKNTVTKIRQWLDSGIFRHDVEGLLPLG